MIKPVEKKARIKHDVFVFPAKALIRLRPFVADEWERYFLQGVYVHSSEKGFRAVGTNGHIMGVLNLNTDQCLMPIGTGIIVSLGCDNMLSRMIEAADTQFSSILCVIKDCKAYVVPAATAQQALDNLDRALFVMNDAVIDGTFPNYFAAIPRAGQPLAITNHSANAELQNHPAAENRTVLNMKYLHGLTRIATDTEEGSLPVVFMKVPTDTAGEFHHSVIALSSGQPDFFAVIMPMILPDQVPDFYEERA